MKNIQTPNAPAAIGPYSQAIIANGMVFTSGQIALKPSGEMLEGDVKEQCTQVLANLKAVLEASGSSLDKVVKTTIFLADMNDFVAVNNGELKTGTPFVEGAVVTAEVINEGRDRKVVIYKKRRRKDSKLKRGFRRDHTRVRIVKIAA